MSNATGTLPEIEIGHVYYTTCIRCGRKLTRKATQETGYGWRCRIKLNRAAQQVALSFSPDQVRKAAQALRSEAVKYDADESAHRGTAVYQCMSSNARDIYFTTRDTCSCPAGEHGRRCYHRCIAQIRDLTPLYRH